MNFNRIDFLHSKNSEREYKGLANILRNTQYIAQLPPVELCRTKVGIVRLKTKKAILLAQCMAYKIVGEDKADIGAINSFCFPRASK
jgi:hypothetical protein